jgi:hypothetical protein
MAIIKREDAARKFKPELSKKAAATFSWLTLGSGLALTGGITPSANTAATTTSRTAPTKNNRRLNKTFVFIAPPLSHNDFPNQLLASRTLSKFQPGNNSFLMLEGINDESCDLPLSMSHLQVWIFAS